MTTADAPTIVRFRPRLARPQLDARASMLVDRLAATFTFAPPARPARRTNARPTTPALRIAR